MTLLVVFLPDFFFLVCNSQNQINLLCSWPTFWFTHLYSSNLSVVFLYFIKPTTVEPSVQAQVVAYGEVVTYKSLDHIGSTFYLISIIYSNCRDLPHVLNVLFMQKDNFKKNPVLSIEKFSSLVLPRDTIWV